MKDCMNISSGTIPTTYQTFLVEQATDLAAHDPASIGILLLPDLLVTATLSTGMQQFYSLAVYHAQHWGLCQKPIRPSSMYFKQAKQPGSLGQFREPEKPISLQPTIEGSVAYSFQQVQHTQCHNFTRVEIGLTMFVNSFHDIINPNEQRNDKILCGYGSFSFRLSIIRIVSDVRDFFNILN